MQSTGSQYHRSNLLANLAYMGSPAAALRSTATAGGLAATETFARAAVPLSDTTTVTTNSAASWATQTQTDSSSSAFGTEALGANAAQPTVAAPTTVVTEVVTPVVTEVVLPPAHTVTTVETGHGPTPTPVPQHVTPAAPSAPQLQLVAHTNVEGDPHWYYQNQEWTEHGTAGDTYLVASGNGVYVSSLYVINGYDDCVMGASQITIEPNATNGLTGDIKIEYGIVHPSQVTIVDQHGHTSTVSINDLSKTLGNIPGVTVSTTGSAITVTTHNAEGQPGTYTIDSSQGQSLSVNVQGNFDDANGVVNFLQSHNNSTGQAHVFDNANNIDNYVESNFNLSKLTAGAGSQYVINYNQWWTPGKTVGW